MENKDRIKKLEEKITNMRLQLEILAKWLKDYKEPFDERDGALESAMNRTKEETMFQIGDYLEEILEMNPDQLEDNLK